MGKKRKTGNQKMSMNDIIGNTSSTKSGACMGSGIH